MVMEMLMISDEPFVSSINMVSNPACAEWYHRDRQYQQDQQIVRSSTHIIQNSRAFRLPQEKRVKIMCFLVGEANCRKSHVRYICRARYLGNREAFGERVRKSTTYKSHGGCFSQKLCTPDSTGNSVWLPLRLMSVAWMDVQATRHIYPVASASQLLPSH